MTNVRLMDLMPAVATAPVIVALCWALSACDVLAPNHDQDLDEIVESGELVVLTVIGPTTFADQDGAPGGYEYDLTQALGEALGVTIRYRVYDDIGAMLAAIEAGVGDIAAGGITYTDERAERAPFAPAYHAVRQQVVCKRGGPLPASVQDLQNVNLAVLAASSYETALERAAAEHQGLAWSRSGAGSAYALLEQVQSEEIDCTVADSNLVAIARRGNPDLVVPFELTEDQSLAWMVSPEAQDLLAYLESWFASLHDTEFLSALDEKYYGFLGAFDYVEISRFHRRLCTRLPEHQTTFERAAATTELPWPLLAAQAYQESHWDPDAKSPTGVRGMMMLTLPTARSVGVTDRLDAEQSIMGGAHYLKSLIDRLPDDMAGDDRLWFALAAYNIGWGHVADARTLADRQGLDKNAWLDVEQTLPLLARKEHYSTLRHGYARGRGAVRYVRQVREYLSILNGPGAPRRDGAASGTCPQ